MMPLMERLWPICRSIMGPGTRETLDILGERVELTRETVPSGAQCFDWVVPCEWHIREAWLRGPSGEKVLDFADNNLHVMGYSEPVHKQLPLEALQDHLYSSPELPEAIPYRTSYYTRRWGFCMSHARRAALKDGTYEVYIDSTLAPGTLEYAHGRVPGRSDEEVLLSTYVCHPSMANNELSGPVLLVTLLELLSQAPAPRYTYHGVFTPETIGTIAFLSRHFDELKQRVRAGYVVSCVGDDGPFNYVRSRHGGELCDRAAEHVLRHVPQDRPVRVRDFDPIGSDERQYCSPGIGLPIGSLLRTRHGEYPEYHTSADDLNFVSEAGLQGSLEAYLRVVQAIDLNCVPVRTDPRCEPQLGRRGLYSTFVKADVEDDIVKTLNLLSFADGRTDLLAIAERAGYPIWAFAPILRKLVEADLIRLSE